MWCVNDSETLKMQTNKTKSMKTIKMTIATFVLGTVLAFQASAQETVVGGEKMYPMKNIVENAVNSKDHTTLVAAVKAADLVETLQSKGKFTVFAPTNDAFENLPAGTVETLLKPENKATLTTVLTYHVISGQYDFAALEKAIKAGKGKATMKTVAGSELTFMMNGPKNITVTDANGGTANISTYDVMQSNGVIHVLDRVLLPKM